MERVCVYMCRRESYQSPLLMHGLINGVSIFLFSYLKGLESGVYSFKYIVPVKKFRRSHSGHSRGISWATAMK